MSKYVSPYAPTRTVTCNIAPHIEHPEDFEQVDSDELTQKKLCEMEIGDFFQTEATYNAIKKVRDNLIKEPLFYGGDIAIGMNSVRDGVVHANVYKMAPGVYLDQLWDWIDLELEALTEGECVVFKFRDVDSLSYASFYLTELWMGKNEVYIDAKQIGVYHGMSFRKIPKGEMNSFRQEDIEKYVDKWNKRERRLNRNGSAPKESHGNAPSLGPAAVKPYHNLEVSESVEIDDGDYTTLQALRTIVAKWGKRHGRRFSIRQRPGGATIHRLE